MPVDGRIVLCKSYGSLARELYRHFGMKKGDALAVQDAIGLWHVHPGAGVQAKAIGFRQAGKNRRVALRGRLGTRARSEMTRLVHLIAARLEGLDRSAQLNRVLFLAASERRTLAERDRLVRKRLREQADKKIRLFSNYSHDLKTPLSMLTVPLQQLILEDESVPVKLRLKLEKIKMAIYGVLRTVSHSLDAARLVTRRQKPILNPHNLTDFIRHIAEVYSIVFESYGIRLESELEADVIAEIDPMQFEKVLNNLLSNALKHNMPGGWVKISIAVKDGTAYLAVADSGLGAEEKPKKETERNPWAFSSHGYGLAIVRELVKLNRGRLQFVSKSGIGTTVTVTLPASPELAPAAQHMRPHNFYVTMHEVELMAAERTALSRRRRRADSGEV